MAEVIGKKTKFIIMGNSVTILVFKFSLRAIFGLVIISGLTIILFFLIMFVYPAYLWLGLPVVFFIIYIQYTGKAPFKTRIIDDKHLTLSTEGIQYGDEINSINDIEAIAIYLYAFENFEYRDTFQLQGSKAFYVCAPGDKNKISFRVRGEVSDFDFYADSYAQFYMIRKIISDWTAEGINVVLKQVFDDEFMLQEMEYYHTPTGFQE
jgi:hypothetical protein